MNNTDLDIVVETGKCVYGRVKYPAPFVMKNFSIVKS